MKRQFSPATALANALSLVLLALFCLLPLAIMFSISLTPAAEIFSQERELVGSLDAVTMENFMRAWKRTNGGELIAASVGVSLTTAVIVTLWGAGVLSTMASFSSRVRSQTGLWLLASRAIPIICLCTPLFVASGILDLPRWLYYTLAMSIILCPLYVWLMLPLAMRFFLEWSDMLRVFGSNSLQSYLLVLVPMFPGTLALVTAAVAVTTWNEGFLASALGLNTLVPTIPSLVSHRGTDWGAIMAIGMISAAPGILLSGLIGFIRAGDRYFAWRAKY